MPCDAEMVDTLIDGISPYHNQKTLEILGRRNRFSYRAVLSIPDERWFSHHSLGYG